MRDNELFDPGNQGKEEFLLLLRPKVDRDYTPRERLRCKGSSDCKPWDEFMKRDGGSTKISRE